MDHSPEPFNDEFRPRVIVWQLTPSPEDANGDSVGQKDGSSLPPVLTTQECYLVIDGIARTARPILVLTGAGLLQRPDLYEIVEYGTALGMKMIVEAHPEDLNEELLRKYSSFGTRIFRVILDECIMEDMNTRFQKSQKFGSLEETVTKMKNEGFEIHFIVTMHSPDARSLAFDHDYAVRRGAKGLYCHLCFDNGDSTEGFDDPEQLEMFLETIAKIKGYGPKNMYVSPQCVKYGVDKDLADPIVRWRESYKDAMHWKHWCLAGKTFAFINPAGVVQPCSNIGTPCGDLRTNGYDFKSVWDNSEVFDALRNEELSCSEARSKVSAEK